MYDYIDSPVSRLEPGARFFIWSARQWVRAAASGRCVCGVIGGAFQSFRVPEATDHFHLVMRTIYQNALVPLYFGSPERETVTEHEAVLLGALQMATAGPMNVVPVARGFVHADMAPILARSLERVAAELTKAGHLLGPGRMPTAAEALRDRIERAIGFPRQALYKPIINRNDPPGGQADHV